ncbi:DUF305 domain-containing protein [Microvirga sp. Mcv34]|uniref:DUF305 domain-containing protein n=1 Tax=Microvirga sp. Mcv34 TaxID=2926016 RepID=UPI0021C7F412|nr:DUF305 domain-containing protein [Microvirga sp. Mcv34]
MKPLISFDPNGTWRAAALLGLATSTYSTLVASLGAGPLAGRDVAVDWMIVGTIPLRASAINAVPTWNAIIAGLLTHQAADFGWTLVFFGLLGRWTSRLRPGPLLMLALPWAAATSAVEYFIVLPWAQPLFVLEQPYWVGLAVHATSSFGYPLFPWLRGRFVLHRDLPGSRGGRRWASVMATVAFIVTLAAMFHSMSLAPPWPGLDVPAHTEQRAFLQRMTAHHELGTILAGFAQQKGSGAKGSVADLSLHDLGELMVVVQESEIRIMNAYWRSWYGGDVPVLQGEEHHIMPGMLEPATVAQLEAAAPGPEFERFFLTVMAEHHRGAVLMANDALSRMADLRLKALASAISHAQRGQLAIMDSLAARLGPLSIQRKPHP